MIREAITDRPDVSSSVDPNRATTPAHPADRRQRALLIAHDPSVRKWGSRWLELAGLELWTASGVAEAQSQFETLTPEVVLLDASLPDGDSLNFCSSLRLADQDLPILSLCNSDKEARRALDRGATDVVTKPIDWQVLSRRAAYMATTFRSLKQLEQARAQLEETRLRADRERERRQQLDSVDRLTGLPNRQTFDRALEKALVGSAHSGGGVAVLLLDLDRFKVLNESFGRPGGDSILKQVAQLLSGRLLRSDFIARHHAGLVTAAVARLSGDEFIMMLSNVEGRSEVTHLVQNLFEALSGAFTVGEIEAYVSASVGVAISPADGDDVDTLLLHSEIALCDAKQRGGGVFRFYSDSQTSETERHLEIDRMLRRSLERGELSLHYQPLVDSPTRRIVGAEALLRWNHPRLGQVAPLEFIPVAEQSGLMVPIGTWVLRTACRQLAGWIDGGMLPIRMAVNVSLCQLQRGDLAEVVREVLQETSLPAALLELELSERGTLRGDPEILEQLVALKQLGVRLSVDDFGTGHSAIAYLKRFPLDTLKIDRSYVNNVIDDKDDAAIASAMVAMAHRLRLGVVAEGVEQQKQLDYFNECGCNEFQGFLFAPGLEASAFRRLMAESGMDQVDLASPDSGAPPKTLAADTGDQP
jgi:diguanylate cyclase (GGDEF)-like protein